MEVLPGQFVEIKVADSPSTYLRRPISICDYDSASRVMTLLIRRAGEGTDHLCNLPEGSGIDIVGPLGNGFSIPAAGSTALLAGGGIGVAPLMLLGKKMTEKLRKRQNGKSAVKEAWPALTFSLALCYTVQTLRE